MAFLLSDKDIFQVTMTYLLGDNNMGSSAEDGNGGDDGEGSEDDEAETVQNLGDHYCHDGHQVSHVDYQDHHDCHLVQHPGADEPSQHR